MSPERWHRIEQIFEEARHLAPSQRSDFLVKTCENDEPLRREIESLLAYEAKSGSLFKNPALHVAAADLAAEQSHMVGRQLGPYHLVSLLGRGGMGEVYRAADKRLGRDVAVKVLPADVTQKMRDRFAQEARAAGHLNHPNIVSVYDVGHDEGVSYIVSELVEGKSLREMIGALPFKKVIDFIEQIGEGLAAAHDAGIVHRDLKPENIMITGSGRVKILDFGLSKDLRAAKAAASSDNAFATSTEAGLLMGTAGYMSPEQVRGLAADWRSDIFSFGVILYEMLTGKRPFQGRSPVETMSATLHEDTPELPESVPAALRQIAVHCLEKDPQRRFQSAHDLVFGIHALRSSPDWMAGSDPAIVRESIRTPQPGRPILPTPASVPHRRFPRRLIWIGAGLGICGLVLGAIFLIQRPSLRRLPAHLPLTTYPGAEFHPALSADGELLAFSWNGRKQDNLDIYVRQLDSGTLSQVTSDPAPDVGPAWAPDGHRLAFRRILLDGTSQIIVKSVIGGPERKLAELPNHTSRNDRFIPISQDLAWSPDGKWLVSTGRSPGEASRLWVISTENGDARPLTKPPAHSDGDFAPSVSPDGRTLAFVRAPNPFLGELYISEISEQFASLGELRQITFDNRIVTSPTWTADGRSIVFASDREGNPRRLWRVTLPLARYMSGTPEPERVPGTPDLADDPAISRRGNRLVYTQIGFDLNIWAFDLAASSQTKSSTPYKLIASTQLDLMPDISPDGAKIAYGSDSSGYHEIWICDRDGSNGYALTAIRNRAADPHWSPDGKQILFVSRIGDRSDLNLISPRGGQPRKITPGDRDCTSPSWSRDGKWIYFASPQGGVSQVWKMPSGGGEPIQVTKHGGLAAVESEDGKFIYYSKSRGLYSNLWKVPADGGDEIEVLRDVTFGRNFAVTGKGIYFIPWTGRSGPIVMPKSQEGTSVRFFDFATKATKTVFTTDKPVYIGLAISSDQHSLLYTQIDRAESDIWMIDNFQ
ncbi:MAG: protein kinase [Bryobacteraceae bacterium]